jgi:ATP sulfurylase
MNANNRVMPDITLNERQMCDLELLATGAFSPLKGFMTRSDYESVLDRMRLQNDILWPIPICLQFCMLKMSGQLIAQRKRSWSTVRWIKPTPAPIIYITEPAIITSAANWKS